MNTVKTRPPKPSSPLPSPVKKSEPAFKNLLLMGIVLTFILVAALKVSDYLEWDGEGNPKLSAKRHKKMEKSLRQLEDAEQYALLVETPGYYYCYSCPDTTHIFLHFGEVFKYGSTVKKFKGRYRNSLIGTGIAYQTQFTGNILECKRMELIRIYEYPLLPENLKRTVPLIRPPGNKIDH
ncbi:MAG: hypothetical protein SFV55_02285 [Haliscomenobacter sp.]|uniref:hypothetical protein n=1 Tax=Haliscomenobacter sp. TaxID=2717303 RepID=UPI0029B50AE4|nr:hypothetical protein [Haliscomenobacter sp.]MDX2067221.1 hypothetical protein [Haliscomenobacter sp.]